MNIFKSQAELEAFLKRGQQSHGQCQASFTIYQLREAAHPATLMVTALIAAGAPIAWLKGGPPTDRDSEEDVDFIPHCLIIANSKYTESQHTYTLNCFW